MRVLKLRFESICNPKYLYSVTTCNLSPDVKISGFIFILFFEKNMVTVLDMFNSRQDCSSQVEISDMASVSFEATSSVDFPWAKITVSSAYIKVSQFLHTDGKSLMYKLKRTGPIIEPCGTPVDNSN